MSVRRVNYGSSRTVVLAKWRKAAIHFMTIRHHKQKLTLPLTVDAQIAPIKDFSYQIRLVRMTPDGANLNASVFLDAHQELGIVSYLRPTIISNACFMGHCLFHGSLHNFNFFLYGGESPVDEAYSFLNKAFTLQFFLAFCRFRNAIFSKFSHFPLLLLRPLTME